jgi:hypothetical protein
VDLATATERELLIHLVRSTHRMEALMSNLDDAVTAIEENVAKLEALASGLRNGSFPAAGTDTPPSDVPA